MAAAERPTGGPTDPMRTAAQSWEAGYQALTEGWRQAQDFWNNVARSWGEAAGTWMSQLQGTRSPESATMLRELQEAAFAVSQAWMRLPMILASGAQPAELQEAITRLTEAQGRAYRMWMEAVAHASRSMGAGGRAPGGDRGASGAERPR